MKRNSKLFALCLLTLFASVSCLKHPEGQEGENNGGSADNPVGVLIPGGFTWATTNSVNLTVYVNDLSGTHNFLVEVFDQNPLLDPDGANLIARGVAKQGKPFTSRITVPNVIQSVFVRQTAPDGTPTVRMVSVTNGEATCNFGTSVAAAAFSAEKKAVAATKSATTELGVVDFTIPAENDLSVYPTEAPAGAVVITTANWTNGGTTDNFKAFIINSQTPNASLQLGQYSAIYVTEDATISGFSNIAYKKLFILPGKKLTVMGELYAGTANWTVSVGAGATLDVKKRLRLEQTNTLYNLGTVIAGNYSTVNSAKFYNKGSFTVTFTGAEDAQLDVTSMLYNEGTVTLAGGLKTTGAATIYNAPTGVISVAGKINQHTVGNRFINDNTITCNEYVSTGSAKTLNNGKMTVAGLTEIRSADTWINNGCWTTNTMTTVSYNATYRNACKLIVNDQLDLKQARFVNGANAYVFAKWYVMINTRVEMGSGSLFEVEETGSFSENRPNAAEREGFYGTGTNRAVLKFAKVEAGNTSPNIVYYGGNLLVVCEDHPGPNMPSGLEPRWSMDSNVEWATLATAKYTIAETECSAGFNNTPDPVDPIDPTPEDIRDPYNYTYIFEDEWPAYSDYDMNDIVIRVTDIVKTPNADNKITKVKFNYSLQAVGASRAASAGLMLDGVGASNIASVSYSDKQPVNFALTGKGVEEGQPTAVIPLFDNAHQFLSRNSGVFINTVRVSENNVAPVPVITVEVNFETPLASLDISSFNMFIVTSTSGSNLTGDNRREIHLRGYQPTAKADTSLFGTNKDNSKSGVVYSSKDNMIWALVIPSVPESGASFRWPLEARNIKTIYNTFADWVQSGGVINPGWWLTPSDPNGVY